MIRRRAIVAALLVAVATSRAARAEQSAIADVKAAFLFNFAKFTQWPAIGPADAIEICVVGDETIARALTDLTRGQKIDGHAVETRTTAAPSCRVLFVSAGARNAVRDAGRTTPILTVSDGGHFAASGGMIELFVEHDRMRFAVNVDAVQRAHLILSSRLLGLAKIVRDDHGQ